MKRKEPKIKKEAIITIFLAAIMVFSIFGIMIEGFTSNSQKVFYGKQAFSMTDNGWVTKIGSKNFIFSYLPEELKDINVSNEIKNIVSEKKEIDFTSEFNDTFKQQIAFIVFDSQQKLSEVNIYLRDGFTAETEYQKPIINCNNQSYSVPIIYLKSGDATAIKSEGNCITISATSTEDLVRFTEKIIYIILGIKEERT